MKAAPHPQQAARLEALHRLGVLDTPREGEFDDIVALASEICETPISVINLVDEARQWFKAEVGLGVRETPLDTSICSHVILDNAFVEIPDTLDDGRTADNPLCKAETGLRFYAGAQLVTADNLPIGTLCVLDTKPRVLTPHQRRALSVLARQVMVQFELRKALQIQEMLRKEIDHRIKNSLQSVAAIVRLQAGRVEDAESKSVLEGLGKRIRAIAHLHEAIYQSTSAEAMDGRGFADTIARHLREHLPENVQLGVRFDTVELDAAQAHAVAVAMNEFVANSVKYAFVQGRGGAIEIAGRVGGGRLVLDCRDNGGGVVQGKTEAKPGGIGLKIVEAAAANVAGSVEVGPVPGGYALSLSFPL
jgi:two-component sensor histidine kinase